LIRGDDRTHALTGRSPRPNLLRELSEQAILETIFREGPITRPEIAERTRISKPTVSAVVNRLVQARLVQEAGERPGRRGRTPIAYTVDSSAGFVVGVDIGSTALRVAAVDIYGEVLREDELETTKDGEVGEQISGVVRKIDRALSPKYGELLAMGVSTPGVVDPATRRVTSLAWHVSDTGQLESLAALESRFGVPVLVDNDINMAAVGEKWHGLARDVSTFLFISIGAGVGMGLVIDDDLFRGSHGAAGEIGYLPLAQDPFDAHHRRLGALEDEIGAAGVVDAYNRGIGASDRPASEAPERTKPDSAGRPRPATSAREVFARSAEGDAAAQKVVKSAAQRLGLAIATVCAVVDPELVVLGGRIGGSADLLPAVRATVERVLPLPTRIETSVLAERASLEGALVMGLREARERLFSQERRSAAVPG
jgi:predicted NBD/HSP70 family sugar kinase